MKQKFLLLFTLLSIALNGWAELISIADAKKLDNDEEFMSKGVVTFYNDGFFAVQDETGGVYVSLLGMDETGLNPGDEVTFTAKNNHECCTNGEITDVAKGVMPEPILVTPADLLGSRKDECSFRFVRLENVEYCLYNNFPAIKDDNDNIFYFPLNSELFNDYEIGSILNLNAVYIPMMGEPMMNTQKEWIEKVKDPAPKIISIADAKKLNYGEEFMSKGVVTYINSIENVLYVQDKTGACSVYLKDNDLFSSISTGDSLTFSAEKDDSDFKDAVVLEKTAGVMPEPKPVTIADLSDMTIQQKYSYYFISLEKVMFNILNDTPAVMDEYGNVAFFNDGISKTDFNIGDKLNVKAILIAMGSPYLKIDDKKWVEKAPLSEVDIVIALIDSIGEVTYDEDCKERIEKALNAYNELDDNQKEQVTNYETLENAEKTFNDYDDVAIVENLIDAIGEVTYDEDCKARIEDAIDAYNELDDSLKELVCNAETLEEAEKTFNDLDAIDTVEGLIDAIGDVVYLDNCLVKIEAARKAYDELDDSLKDKVSNYEALENAERTYNDLMDVADVISLIDAIGEVTYDEDCKERIAAARKAYNELNGNLKEDVTNFETLEEAENAIIELGIKAVSIANKSGKAVNLAGQYVGKAYKGIVISDGKKMLNYK